jgi:uncharacterized protein YjbI with pentapeptide repeats
VARARGHAIEPPEVISLPELSPFVGTSVVAHGDYEAVDFLDLDLAGQVADDAAFLACRIERCGLDRVSMRRTRISECLLADIHAVSVDLADSVWRDSLLTGGRLGAMTASGATWTSVRVRGGKLDFVDLGRSRLLDVVFEGCVIGELDLTGAQLRSVRFVACTVDELNVEGARLSEVDLTGATLRTLGGLGSLRGAIVGPEQLLDLAPLLAAHVGLEVRTD